MCKHDKGSKAPKEVKVKKEPGLDEGSIGGTTVGAKHKAVAKVDDEEPKLKKSWARSFAMSQSTGPLSSMSISFHFILSSSLMGDGDFNMDAPSSSPPADM